VIMKSGADLPMFHHAFTKLTCLGVCHLMQSSIAYAVMIRSQPEARKRQITAA
jgi:hypothetical protein